MKKKIISIPPTYFYILIIFNIVFYFIFKEFNMIKFPFNLSGVLLIIPGFYMVIKSYYIFKKNNTPERYLPVRCLVKESLYNYSRNPMYLGGVIRLIGITILISNTIAFILPFLFFMIMNFMFIPYEEQKMLEEVGEEYIEYKNKVSRWF